MYFSLMFDTATTHHKYLKGSCRSIQEVPSHGWLFLQVAELCLSSYLWLRWVQLKLILEGRWLVVRASSGHISFSDSAVLLCHSHQVWNFFTAQFVFHFIFTEGFSFLASSIPIVGFSPFKTFQVTCNRQRQPLCVCSLTAFASFSFSKSLRCHSIHPRL